MKKIILNPNKLSPAETEIITGEIKRGKVIACPTDTVYGLSCDATNRAAINKIYKIKNRPKTKPMLVLVNGFEMLRKFFIVSEDQFIFLKQIWPGPYSAILKAKKNLPDILRSDDDSGCVRFPKNKFLISLVNGINRPIVSTSLNKSDDDNISDLNMVDKYFPKKLLPDLLVDKGRLKSKKPSKIIDIRDIYNIKIIRK